MTSKKKAKKRVTAGSQSAHSRRTWVHDYLLERLFINEMGNLSNEHAERAMIGIMRGFPLKSDPHARKLLANFCGRVLEGAVAARSGGSSTETVQ